MISETDGHDRTTDLAADQRWAAWVTKGVEHDKRVRHRAILAAALLSAAATVWAAAVLFR
jgi:hypothetical protein